jgi:hypothetical protein
MKSRWQNRLGLLQGTLDVLILQHGYGIGNAIRANSGELLEAKPDRSIRRSIAWKSGVR